MSRLKSFLYYTVLGIIFEILSSPHTTTMSLNSYPRCYISNTSSYLSIACCWKPGCFIHHRSAQNQSVLPGATTATDPPWTNPVLPQLPQSIPIADLIWSCPAANRLLNLSPISLWTRISLAHLSKWGSYWLIISSYSTSWRPSN